jgi:hypothetical protein
MTADEIIAKDQKIARILRVPSFAYCRVLNDFFSSGQTKKIVARDSKIFAVEIAKYIDSKDQRRGKDKDKKKDKKDKKDKNKDANTPALWPLIRQVNVRCSAAALATGAILVDLPGKCNDNYGLSARLTSPTGSGDANAARSTLDYFSFEYKH